ncbi:MAG: PD40 domain-containing protein [Rhizobiales bacterium]|nr:PD40 domain-containing protein [Hyphomicrobiales bacterium]
MNRRRLLALPVGVASLRAGLRAVRADNPIPPGRIAYIRDGAVWVWSNGDSSQLVAGSQLSDARWSPSGDALLYIRSGDSYSDLYLYNIASQTETQLTFNKPDAPEGSEEYAAAASWVIDPSWSASGVVGYISDANSSNNTFALWTASNPYTGTATLAPVAVSEDNIDSLSLSPDGSIAAYVERTRNADGTSTTSISLRDLSDGQVFDLPSAGPNTFDPAIGPDGQLVAFSKRDGGMTDVWISSRQGGAATQVTSGYQATNPCWSPDGKWLAFIRMIDYKFKVWVAPMTGATPGTSFELFDPKNIDAPSGLAWVIPKTA